MSFSGTPAAAAGPSGTTKSTSSPNPLAKPSCSLTTVGTSDVSTPRNVIGTFGIFSWRSGGPGAVGGAGGGGEGCANPATGTKAMIAMVRMNFVLIFLLLVFRLSLAGNGNEDDFVAWIGNTKRFAGLSVAPLQCLPRLITKTPHWPFGTVCKVQSFVPRVVNDLRRTGRNELIGRC